MRERLSRREGDCFVTVRLESLNEFIVHQRLCRVVFVESRGGYGVRVTERVSQREEERVGGNDGEFSSGRRTPLQMERATLGTEREELERDGDEAGRVDIEVLQGLQRRGERGTDRPGIEDKFVVDEELEGVAALGERGKEDERNPSRTRRRNGRYSSRRKGREGSRKR